MGLKPWIRLYARHARGALRRPGGAALLCSAADADPEGWRSALVSILPDAKAGDRHALIEAVIRHANRDTVQLLRDVPGKDIVETRRRLQHVQAARIYLRTLGGVRLHRGGWDGPELKIDKKRVRMLLAVLGAHAHTTLTRDMAIDILWPEADADAAINNLNQTVFQLRRYIDPHYKGGESPEYVVSTSEQLGVNAELVHTDLVELRRLPARLATGDWQQRQIAARRAVGLVTGEFLADLRYESWTSVQQVAVHNSIREKLLPIALAPVTGYDIQIASQAASALIAIDPFDEEATLALADCLSRSGRRVAARDLVMNFAQRMQAELDEEPSHQIAAAMGGSPTVN